jgi:hypothetical protein
MQKFHGWDKDRYLRWEHWEPLLHAHVNYASERYRNGNGHHYERWMAAQIHVCSFTSLAEDSRQSLVMNAELRLEIGIRRWPGVR